MLKQQIRHYRVLNKWFKSPLGLLVASEFSKQLAAMNDYLRGETLLQLGHCGENSWLNSLHFDRKWVTSPFSLENKIHLECSLNQIPLSRNSLDCVVLPLTLEPFGNHLSVIDEIDRVLKPMGFVILLSINPWSLWGMAMKCGLLHCYQDHKIKMRSAFQVNRIFLQRGYKQYALSNFCYIPPINSKSFHKDSSFKKIVFFDEIGKMLWPFPSGLYCYVTQKRVHGLPSLKPEPIVRPFAAKYKPSLQPATNELFD